MDQKETLYSHFSFSESYFSESYLSELHDISYDTIIFLAIIFIVILIIGHQYYMKNLDEVPDVEWPFLNLKDENGRNINMLVVRGYLEYNRKNTKQFLEYLNRGIKFIGCSSHQSFPRVCNNPYGGCHKAENIKVFGKDVEDFVLGWCHCFREPEKYIKPGIPKILISESDFNSEDALYDPSIKKRYEQCEIGWNGESKKWDLAEKCIQVLSDELGLIGLIVGRGKCPINVKNKDRVISTPILKKSEFHRKIMESRFMLLPNTEEASPRVLTESLVLNTPVMVNNEILGGWKYVNDKTGLFFTENTIKESAIRILNNIKRNTYSPREDYLSKYGLKKTGRELRDFLKSINPDLSDCEYVRFDTSI